MTMSAAVPSAPARASETRWWVVTALLALVAFAHVQDRVTAAGARRYVAEQRLALDGQGELVPADQAMRPANARAVRAGLAAASGVVLLSGVARVIALRSRRPS